MSTKQMLLSGFGGQGILFAGKFLAYKGLTDGKQVSWLPSYGPEMRGGTASCSVIISDDAVGSPIISNPDILVAMNLPSLDKFENTVVSGGIILADSTLIERKVLRDDVTVISLGFPLTKLEEGGASSAYIVWNTSTDALYYYVIDHVKGKDTPNLVQVTEDGKHTILGEAPTPGNEMAAILEMIDAEC